MQDSQTHNVNVQSYLEYYCGLSPSPDFAVMLVGPWGGGKTWFVRDFLDSHAGTKSFYVSLYGLSHAREVEVEILQQIHPVLMSKTSRALGRVVASALRINAAFDLNSDGIADGSASMRLPKSESGIWSIPEDAVLVLDDLERCEMPIRELMGMINRFVEHGKLRVILVANEDELCSQLGADCDGYRRAKEKIVAHTFAITSEFAPALKSFIANLSSENNRSLVERHIADVRQVHECSGRGNLRLLRHALHDLDRLLLKLPADLLAVERLVSDLIKVFIAYAIEILAGDVLPSEVGQIAKGRYWAAAKSDESQAKFIRVYERYRDLDLDETLVPSEIWSEYFASGSLPDSKLILALRTSRHFPSNEPDWMSLWSFDYLADADFERVLKSVENQWENRRYREVGVVLHVAALLLEFARSGILSRDEDEILAEAKRYAVDLHDELRALSQDRSEMFLERIAYKGRGFVRPQNPKFQEFVDCIGIERNLAIEANRPREAAELLELMKTDTMIFCRRLILSNDPENKYYRIPILRHLDPPRFVDAALTLSGHQLAIVGHAIKQRYEFSDFWNDLATELEWVRDVLVLLELRTLERKGKLSGYFLARFHAELGSAVERFKMRSSAV
jgi:hypothetical protein